MPEPVPPPTDWHIWKALSLIVARAEEIAEWRRAKSVDDVELEVEEHHTGGAFAARGSVVKHLITAKLHVVVALVLAVAADAVLVANHLPNLSCQSDYRTDPPKCDQTRAKKQLKGKEHAGEKKRAEGRET